MSEDESNIQIVFGTSSGPPSTDTNSMGFRTPTFKHTSSNSSSDKSAQTSSICKAAELLSCFSLRIAMYVDLLQPIEPSLFFSHEA